MVSRPPSARHVPNNSPTNVSTRSLLLGGLLAVWMLILLGRLYHLQIIQYVELSKRAQRQQQRTVEVASKRGTIFDRQMHPLAMSLAVDSIFAVPAEIPNPEMTTRLLASALGLQGNELRGRFKAFRSFCWVKRRVTEEESARVRDLNLQGIYFQKEAKRFYPKGELAAQVLGYVGLDEQGLGGLEYKLEGIVRGKPGRVWLAADARRQSFGSTGWEGQPGKNVVLTIDENIQYIAEKALAEAMGKWHAAGGTVVVQNPHTGEILAMASQPSFNPNHFARSAPEARVNRATGWVFEPGSTFKLVAVSAALEEKLTHPDEVIHCQWGSIVLAGHTIRDHKAYGDLSVRQVMAQSSDVGVIKLALRLGPERMFAYVRKFGFGAPTQIELPGEERGLLQPPRRWSGISIGEISMGQEVGVTALQLVTAYSAIANGGILFQPRILRDVFQGSQHEPLVPTTGQRVISQRTAEVMSAMLTEAVETGTGKAASLQGYSAAGKTGTAQKIDASGRYSKTHYIASFVGFAPVRKPAVTILVVIDSPAGAIYGGEVAAPVFRTIAEQTLGYLSVPQDNPSRWPQVVPSAPARPARQTRTDLVGFLPSDSELPRVVTSPVHSVSFTPFPVREEPEVVVVDEGPRLTVPEFSGLALRRAVEASQRLGLELDVRGTGVAVEQFPPAGTRVPVGARVLVRFAR